MKKESVVLLSGGLDSSVNLYAAIIETDVKLALTFDYGQKAAKKEIMVAHNMCADLKIKHTVIELPWFKELGKSALNHSENSIPTGKKISIDNQDVSKDTAKAVWVPNRNGLFLNIAAAFAESLGAHMVIPGFNREEAVSFPDNSLDFIRATRKSLGYSTANAIDIQCFTINMGKSEIVALGKKLTVPFEKIWPCYFDKDLWCGECESCQRAKRAFKVGKVDVSKCFDKF